MRSQGRHTVATFPRYPTALESGPGRGPLPLGSRRGRILQCLHIGYWCVLIRRFTKKWMRCLATSNRSLGSVGNDLDSCGGGAKRRGGQRRIRAPRNMVAPSAMSLTRTMRRWRAGVHVLGGNDDVEVVLDPNHAFSLHKSLERLLHSLGR